MRMYVWGGHFDRGRKQKLLPTSKAVCETTRGPGRTSILMILDGNVVYKAEGGRTRGVAGGTEMLPLQDEAWGTREMAAFSPPAGPSWFPRVREPASNLQRLAAGGNELARRTLQPAGLALQGPRLLMLSDSAGE